MAFSLPIRIQNQSPDIAERDLVPVIAKLPPTALRSRAGPRAAKAPPPSVKRVRAGASGDSALESNTAPPGWLPRPARRPGAAAPRECGGQRVAAMQRRRRVAPARRKRVPVLLRARDRA